MAYWKPGGYHQMGQGEYAGITAKEGLKRMKEATGMSTMLELASCLGTRQSWLSDTERRNIIPVAWLRDKVVKVSHIPK